MQLREWIDFFFPHVLNLLYIIQFSKSTTISSLLDASKEHHMDCNFVIKKLAIAFQHNAKTQTIIKGSLCPPTYLQGLSNRYLWRMIQQ